MIHQLVYMVSVFADSLASGDQRRLTESGSALEAITRNELYKSTFTLLYSDKLRSLSS